MARMIDAEFLEQEISKWINCPGDGEYYCGYDNALTAVLDLIADAPTLTPPNEWISVEDRLPEPGDLIVYADNTVWGYQYGICRVCGKEKAFDYWMPLQDLPNNRPPEGEEDNND